MIGDDFLTVGWFTQVTVTAIGVIAILTILVVAWFIGNTSPGTQPIGTVKSYPPRPIPPLRSSDSFPPRPVLTECAFCDTPIIPGAIDTSCRNCGAPIKPIVVGAMKIKVPPPGPPATIYGAYEPFVPVGESIAQKLAQAIDSALSEPKPPPMTDSEFRRALDDLEKSVDAVKRQTEQERRQLNNLRSLQRNPDALDHRLIGTVRR